MTEKDTFLQTFEREYQTTLRVLKAYPSERADLKPSPKSRTAQELAWMLALNQGVMIPTLDNKLDPTALPKPPKSWTDVLGAFEAMHRDSVARLERSTEDEWERSIPFTVGPGKVADLRVGDALWFFLHDTIHHRGQLTVYLRIAGGKLPSVYGPTADEPWSGAPAPH
jgi:uncharacterized damage-inducible protein DinB